MTDVETMQATFKRDIQEGENIAVTMHCVSCSTFRTFIIHEALGLMLEQQWSAIGIRAQCSNCEHVISFTLGWHPTQEGYASNPVSVRGQMGSVTDNAPLAPH